MKTLQRISRSMSPLRLRGAGRALFLSLLLPALPLAPALSLQASYRCLITGEISWESCSPQAAADSCCGPDSCCSSPESDAAPDPVPHAHPSLVGAGVGDGQCCDLSFDRVLPDVPSGVPCEPTGEQLLASMVTLTPSMVSLVEATPPPGPCWSPPDPGVRSLPGRDLCLRNTTLLL